MEHFDSAGGLVVSPALEGRGGYSIWFALSLRIAPLQVQQSVARISGGKGEREFRESERVSG